MLERLKLKSVDTGYRRDLRCMEGTRDYILKEIVSWVTNDSGNDAGNAYWIYGSPGVGKTTLAHSICADLHEGKHLAGAFFCRNEQNLNEPRSILRTFSP